MVGGRAIFWYRRRKRFLGRGVAPTPASKRLLAPSMGRTVGCKAAGAPGREGNKAPLRWSRDEARRTKRMGGGGRC